MIVLKGRLVLIKKKVNIKVLFSMKGVLLKFLRGTNHSTSNESSVSCGIKD